MPDTADPGIRSRPDRIEGLGVPGTAFRADEMVGHLRHRHALRQAKAAGIDIEVAHRPAIAAMDLQQLSCPDQIADGDRLRSERLGLAPAAGLIPFPLQLDQLDQLG